MGGWRVSDSRCSVRTVLCDNAVNPSPAPNIYIYIYIQMSGQEANAALPRFTRPRNFLTVTARQSREEGEKKK